MSPRRGTPSSTAPWRYGALALAVMAAAACAAPSARLSGRVVHQDSSLAGAEVTLHSTAEGLPLTAPTDEDGVYEFVDLSPGTYNLGASAHGDPPLGARSGKNPILVAPGADLWIGLQAVPREEPTFRPAPFVADGFGSLSGVLLFNEEAVSGAVVDVYLHGTGGLRGPGFRQSFPTGEDGVYTVDEVTEGLYQVVARRRASGAAAGPVLEGDLYGEALANPVPVRSGQETVLDVHLVRKERSDDPNADRLAIEGSGIEGQVVDAHGTPVAGVYVFAYRNRVVGHGMPDFRTLPTDTDGAFALALGDGGLFYVGAREHTGGSPLPGEWFGFYEGSADHGITVPAGKQRDGIRIVVRRVLEP